MRIIRELACAKLGKGRTECGCCLKLGCELGPGLAGGLCVAGARMQGNLEKKYCSEREREGEYGRAAWGSWEVRTL